jgi:glycosyltransferase involved in cell wall biosynthesis
MKSWEIINQAVNETLLQQSLVDHEALSEPIAVSRFDTFNLQLQKVHDLPEVLVISSYPPRECGIATYSQDLIGALNNKFSHSLAIKVCALESGIAAFNYPPEVKYVLKTSLEEDYDRITLLINKDTQIKIILIQHEFGLFKEQEQRFIQFIHELIKPVVIVFHTVLPHPDALLRSIVQEIAAPCESIVVMTHNSAGILVADYGLAEKKISVIAHGTHLVPHLSEKFLKNKYGLSNRKVITTFGLLSAGKSIETTLEALPAIIRQCPEVLFLAIGKTHPEVVRREGEAYRKRLEDLVEHLGLGDHVRFINNYLALPDLLEYLQLTDIYLFTSSDPNQAVSGTFVYAMSCACPIISTPIPHAREVLSKDTGIIFDFRNSHQLADGVIRLLRDEPLRRNISSNTLQKIVSTAWENSAVAHAMLFEKMSGHEIIVRYNLPEINLNHLKKLSTAAGIIQFSKINQPDIDSGYTLDDNSRALIAMCMHYEESADAADLIYIQTYLNFIFRCQLPKGDFINYVDGDNRYANQNDSSNLEDSNGRAIWALGYLISKRHLFEVQFSEKAESILLKSLKHIEGIHSTRAMAFVIKGLYYYGQVVKSTRNISLLETFANRLVEMYRHESKDSWRWFESYLTYANSILPEAMLYAWSLTGDSTYRSIALESFDFLLSQTFKKNGIEVISNKEWLKRGFEAGNFGEQPIDVAYTIMTLNKFYELFGNESYRLKMEVAFNWFLGNNRLHQIIYNPCTGGSYDGLEELHVNLNQGAESTVSYLMARLTMNRIISPGRAFRLPI